MIVFCEHNHGMDNTTQRQLVKSTHVVLVVSIHCGNQHSSARKVKDVVC